MTGKTRNDFSLSFRTNEARVFVISNEQGTSEENSHLIQPISNYVDFSVLYFLMSVKLCRNNSLLHTCYSLLYTFNFINFQHYELSTFNSRSHFPH